MDINISKTVSFDEAVKEFVELFEKVFKEVPNWDSTLEGSLLRSAYYALCAFTFLRNTERLTPNK